MAANGLSIIPRYISILDDGTYADAAAAVSGGVPTSFGTTAFQGLETDGRTFDVNVEEITIEDGQTTALRYSLNWEFFIGGNDAMSGTYVNKPSTSPKVLSQVVVWGATGTLGMAIDDVYVNVKPDFTGGQLRTRVKMTKDFILSPNETNSPLITFTTPA